MEHLLIILFFLLLTSPLFGQSNFNYEGNLSKNKVKGTVLYLCDTSVGQVWEDFGDEDVQPIYKGRMNSVNWKPHGLGIMYNGRLHVDGRINFSPGWTFNGEWKDGEIHGQGTFRKKVKDGKFFELIGQFKEGRRWNTNEYYGNILRDKYVNGKS